MNSDLRSQLQTALGDNYTLERELGGGGMSRVFLAEERRLGRRVVVKVLSPELAMGISVERFEREIRTAAAMQQANIVPVLSAGDTDGIPYYTMPFVEGESLRSRLGRGPLSITEVISVVRDVTRALAYAHARGVVHRDIKPDNVLLSGGTAVVTDFGIAKAVSAARTGPGSATLTQIGTSIGTPAYMAPEQAAGDPAIDQRADLYSLGCLAYELLAGQPPFAASTPQGMLAAHLAETPPPVAERRGDTPPALARLVTDCLAKKAADRPPSAADVVRVLDTITSGGGMPAMPTVLLGGPGMFRRALVIYAAAFAMVAVLARAAIVGIGLPDWVFPGALIVMALVLPVLLWTGYVQRVTRRAMTQTPTYTPGGTPSTTAHGTMATLALKAAPHVSWYRTARGGMYALGAFIVIVAAFMAMRALGIGPAASLMAAGKLKAKEPIIMTDFSASNGDTALARVVSFAVRTGLAESPVLAIATQAQMADGLQLMEQPRTARVDLPLAEQMAKRFGVKAIVDGDVTPVGSGYVVTVRLITGDSARTIASFQKTGEGSTGLINAADRIARDVRAKAGESLRSVQAAPGLAAVTTASLDALRQYSQGSFAMNVEQDYPRAVARLEEAVAADTTFAEAWRRLSMAKYNIGYPHSEVASALAEAFRFRDRLTDRERRLIEGTYYSSGPHPDREKAIAVYERMLAAGDSTWALNNLAFELLSRREFARADSLMRANLRLLPRFLLGYQNLLEALVGGGELDAADSVVRSMPQRFPTATAPRQLATQLLYLRHRLDAYRTALDSARRVPDPSNPSWALWRSAELALLEGRVGAWQRYHAAAVAADSTAGVKRTAIQDAETRAWVDAVVREKATAGAALLDTAVAREPLHGLADLDRPDLGLAAAYAVTGRPARAQTVLQRYRAEVKDTAVRRINQPDEHTALAGIALANRKWSEALRQFRKADSLPDGPANECAICLPLNLARTFDAAGMADSAIAQFQLYLRTPYFFGSGELLDASVLPLVHERLGRLYEAKGDVGKAIEHDEAFIELWKSSDPELAPRVAEARRRVARLSAMEKPKD